MKNNKKGFTLIEMMIVIAVVAVLVTIIIPTVLGSHDKAAAATNAANLRSAEGQLLSMMLLEPGRFKAVENANREQAIDNEVAFREYTDPKLKELNDNLEAAKKVKADIQAEIDDALANLDRTLNTWTQLEAQRKAAADAEHAKGNCVEKSGLFGIKYWDHSSACDPLQDAYNEAVLKKAAAQVAKNNPEAVTKAYQATMKAADQGITNAQADIDAYLKESETIVENLRAEKDGMYKYQADDEGWITLDDGSKIQLPLSEKVKIDTVDCPKGVPMFVYLDAARREFYCEYQEYDKDDFARVADEKAAS